MAEGAASTLSAAPRESTAEKMAILSKQVSLPTWIYGPAQRVPTELTPAVAHTLATLAPEADGLWAVPAPLVPTSYPLSLVSARTASRESSLVLLPQLAEAHGTSAGPQLPAEPGTEATTMQSGRSALAQSIAATSAETLTTITEDGAPATCVVSDLSGHPSVVPPRPSLLGVLAGTPTWRHIPHGLQQLLPHQPPGCKMGVQSPPSPLPHTLEPEKFSRLLWAPDVIAESHHSPRADWMTQCDTRV